MILLQSDNELYAAATRNKPITGRQWETLNVTVRINTLFDVGVGSGRPVSRAKASCSNVQIELEFRSVGFCGGRKTGEHGEKPSEHKENQQQTQPTRDGEYGNRTRCHRGGRRAFIDRVVSMCYCLDGFGSLNSQTNCRSFLAEPTTE